MQSQQPTEAFWRNCFTMPGLDLFRYEHGTEAAVPHDHFQMTIPLRARTPRVLVVTEPREAPAILALFDSQRLVGTLKIPLGKHHSRVLALYDAHNFRGPQAGAASSQKSVSAMSREKLNITSRRRHAPPEKGSSEFSDVCSAFYFSRGKQLGKTGARGQSTVRASLFVQTSIIHGLLLDLFIGMCPPNSNIRARNT